jgi:hypothetical protein
MSPLYLPAPVPQLARLATGQETYPRLLAKDASVSSASGRLRLTYWTARKTETCTQLRLISGSTAAAPAPTLVRGGIYSIDSVGAGTLAAAFANDVAVFSAANTTYTKALTAALPVLAGQTYATATIVVTAAAAPTISGIVNAGSVAAEYGLAEWMGFFLDGQADLPAGVALAALTASASMIYGVVLP